MNISVLRYQCTSLPMYMMSGPVEDSIQQTNSAFVEISEIFVLVISQWKTKVFINVLIHEGS